METKMDFVDTFIERIEQYVKTSFELIKLKLLDRTANIVTTIILFLLLTIIFLLFAFTINIAIALWIGDLLGKNYYGFFVVAGFYILLGIVLYAFRNKWIKTLLRNSVITHVLN